MLTTIDGAGRIVVPKALRNSLGLVPGQRLEIAEVDGRIEIEVPSPVVELVDQGRGLVAVAPSDDMPPLSAADVRRVLDAVRR